MGVCTTMAPELLGVCGLTEILELEFNKSLSVPNIDACIDILLTNQ